MDRKRSQADLGGSQPKPPRRGDVSVDEPASLIRKEEADIEAETPLQDNPNIERGEKEDQTPPAFEES